MRGSCTCFIIPSRILLELAEKEPDAARRRRLRRDALVSEHQRGQRVVRAQMALGTFGGGLRRTIFDCEHKMPSTPVGKRVRGEGDPPTSDTDADAAFVNSGITYKFYREVLRRDSIDGRGMRIDSFVHYGQGYNNAFWDGSQMVYGEGDHVSFYSFATSLDVVAHELSHGVTEYTVPGGPLIYERQSGALNESFSDVFGSLVLQWSKNQTVEQASWLIGEGIIAARHGRALRSMAEPGNRKLTCDFDDQVSSADDYDDDADVHVNSGIPNRAFYLAARSMGGRAYEGAGKIWYRALSLLTPEAGFVQARLATLEAAQAADRSHVERAWDEVGVR